MKKRIFWAALVLALIAGLLLPQAAADAHFALLRDFESLTLNPMKGWAAMFGSSQVLAFYLMFVALVAVFELWALMSGSNLDYRSGMLHLTPEIATPCAAGQGQFGTAKWLPQRKLGKVFSRWNVRRRAPALKELLKAGKADRKEIKNAKIRIDQ